MSCLTLDEKQNTLFHLAAVNDDFQLIENLIECIQQNELVIPLVKNEIGESPITIALARNNKKIAEKLVDYLLSLPPIFRGIIDSSLDLLAKRYPDLLMGYVKRLELEVSSNLIYGFK